MKILITGATGLVGRALSKPLRNTGFTQRIAVRQKDVRLPISCEAVEVGDIGPQTDWEKALAGIDAVIHLATRNHIINDPAADSLNAFRKVNVLGTERLARMAAICGVRRLVFISSIGVNGETSLGMPFSEKDPANPSTAYAVSKWEAEQALHKVSKETGLEIVILRPPLVYGPDAPGNFVRLIRLIKACIPLPFGSVKNLRSFIFLNNLTDAIITCISHPLAAGETFMVSDGQDISTPDLIKIIAFAMDTKPALFSLPPGILKALCKITGKGEDFERLTKSFFVDSSKIRNLLGWRPPFTLEEGVKETVKGYK